MKSIYKKIIATLIALGFVACGGESSLSPADTQEYSSEVQNLSSLQQETLSSSENILESSSSFINLSTIISEDSTITDSRDMKTYKVMKIGKQIWMAENLKYSTEGITCKKGIDDECLYTWAEAMYTNISFNQWTLQIDDSLEYQGLCPIGWRIPTTSDAMKMLSALKSLSDTPYDNVFFCNTIVTEDKLTHEGSDVVHDDYCDHAGAGGKRNGFNMHLSGFHSGLWLTNDNGEQANSITFWEHAIYVDYTSKTIELNLRCIMKDQPQ